MLLRGLQGIALAALPALAMAHVTREVAPRRLGGAVGLLIAGNTIGGLSGRLVASAVADVAGWRLGLLAVGLLSLAVHGRLPAAAAAAGGACRAAGAAARAGRAGPSATCATPVSPACSASHSC